jgi:hypothetical protein
LLLALAFDVLEAAGELFALFVGFVMLEAVLALDVAGRELVDAVVVVPFVMKTAPLL